MKNKNNEATDLFTRKIVSEEYFKTIIPSIHSTGFQPYHLQSYSSETLPINPAEDFLVNSRLLRNDPIGVYSVNRYFTDEGTLPLALEVKAMEQETGVSLPEGPKLTLELGETLMERRSKRLFTGDPVSLFYLASILRGACGITAKAVVPLRQGKDVDLYFRSAPSGGGLYPVDVYLVSLSVEGLEQGIYQYNPKADCLVLHQEINHEKLIQTFAISEDLISIKKSGFIVLLVGRSWKTMRKYGPRGLRLLFLEAGAISQNIHLSVTALGLGSVDCSGFYDDDLNGLLGFDGVNEAVIHTIIGGNAE